LIDFKGFSAALTEIRVEGIDMVHLLDGQKLTFFSLVSFLSSGIAVARSFLWAFDRWAIRGRRLGGGG
jgi:hypothetical protein